MTNEDKERQEYIEKLKDEAVDSELDAKCRAFCERYVVLLRLLYEDEVLREWCRNYSVYSCSNDHSAIAKAVYRDMMDRAYEDGIVIMNYSEVFESIDNKKRAIDPDKEFIESLSKLQIVGCIARLIRADHWCEGSLMSDAVGNGVLLRFVEGYLEKE